MSGLDPFRVRGRVRVRVRVRVSVRVGVSVRVRIRVAEGRLSHLSQFELQDTSQA